MSSKAQAKAAIYNRLANAPTFHPSTVDLFSDCTLQGGDIITVQHDGSSYNVPIFSMNFKWNGASKVTAQSSGNEYRPSLENMAQKQASRRGSGYRSGVRNAEQNQIWGNEFYSEDGALHSVILQTTTYIMTAVENVDSHLYSFIAQTPEMIHAEVGVAVSGFAHSVIEQTATYIRTEVSNAASAISQTVIEQTENYIRSEVSSVASGIAWSVITQTMTNIEQRISSKARVYVQMSQPTGDIYEGDIWIKSTGKRTWNDAATGTWNDASGFRWKDYAGSEMYVYKSGAWVLVGDNAVAAEQEVKIDQTREYYDILGHKVDSQGEEYNSRLRVTAQEIRGELSTSEDKLSSVILQTATNVFSGVYDKVHDNFSTIEQTASSITMAVNSAKGELYSAINVTSTQISLKVGKGEVISSINQTAESITINASKINLEGYVQTTDLVADRISNIFTSSNTLEVYNLKVKASLIYNFSTPGGTSSVGLGSLIKDLRITQSGNTYTLQKMIASSNSWTDVDSFSRATTLSGAWGGGEFTVSASPQGETYKTSLNSGTLSRSGRSVSIPVRATLNGGSQNYATGFNATGTITASKSDISAQRGARQTSEPSTDDRVANCSLNGWYVITVSVLGQSKTFKFNVNVE